MTEIDTSYPLLVEDVGTLRTSRGEAGGTPLATTVEQALRAVLGWRPRADDPKSFVAALTNSFTITPFEGRTEVAWQPRNYAATITADLGAITGAQASLLSRAKTEVDAAKLLLKGLKSLRPGESEEYVTSLRAVVEQTLDEILVEFAYLGGPREPRVDALLERLVGTPLAGVGADARFDGASGLARGGQLLRLGTQLGLTNERVNSVAQEETYTQFVIICDYCSSLLGSWLRYKGNVDETLWFGPGLVKIQRLLAVVAESVHEVELLMDSVFFGADERASRPVAGHKSVSVAGLLDWIESTASSEAPRLLADAGRDGAEALRGIVLRQAEVLDGLRGETDECSMAQNPRVRSALLALACNLDSLEQELRNVQSPALDVSPHVFDDRDIDNDPDPVTEFIDFGVPRRIALAGLRRSTAAGRFRRFATTKSVDNQAIFRQLGYLRDDEIESLFDLPDHVFDPFINEVRAHPPLVRAFPHLEPREIAEAMALPSSLLVGLREHWLEDPDVVREIIGYTDHEHQLLANASQEDLTAFVRSPGDRLVMRQSQSWVRTAAKTAPEAAALGGYIDYLKARRSNP